MADGRRYAFQRRDELLTVAIALRPTRFLREEAKARRWRFVHLWYCDYKLPVGVVPSGALVNNLPDSEEIQVLRQANLPIVRVGSSFHLDDNEVPAVLPDVEAQGRLAAEHFAERGFRNVAYFGRQPWGLDGEVLYRSFREHAQELGMTCHLYRSVNMLAGERVKEDTHGRRKKEFIGWMRDLPQPIGLLAGSDWHAAVYCGWLLQNGFDVPYDVGLLSRGDQCEICEFNFPTISYLLPDQQLQIRTACDILDRMMNKEPYPTGATMIPPRGVVEREGTNVLATHDRDVASALRYMWNHLNKSLSIENVATEVGMSSRQLERRFRAELGRGVNAELQRRRLQELRRLLLSTNIPVADLAPMLGFGSTSYLHRLFRKQFGTTPGIFRRDKLNI